MNRSERHLRLVTETIAAVNSTLDLGELFELVAAKVAEALEADACFVYLYDERADELVLGPRVGSRVEELTRMPKMRPGEGITGTAAADRAPVMIPRAAHLDPRFKHFPNLREEQYESILAVPDPRQGPAGGRPERPHDRAARVRRGRDRAPDGDRRPGRHRRSRTPSSTTGRSAASLSSRRWRRSPKQSPSRSTSRNPSRRS